MPAQANVALEGFLASHQIAIAKMALTYCGELVDTTSYRDAFFGTNAFEFDQPPATAFSNDTKKDVIANALYNKIIITDVASQPTLSEVRDVLFAPTTGLLDQLAQGCAADPNCTSNATRTRTVVKSMCVSVLSSAGMTVQ